MMTPHTNTSPTLTTPTPEPTIDQVNKESTALVLPTPAQKRLLKFEPQTFDEMLRLADIVYEIGLGGCKSAADAVGRMMFGDTLGLSSMVSVLNIFSFPIATGGIKYGTYAQIARALCNRHPLCEYLKCTELSQESVTFELKRKDRQVAQSFTWTVADAVKAGLVDRGKDEKGKEGNNYNKYPRSMLIARASMDVIRLELPEVLTGLGIVEEMQETKRVEYDVSVVPQAQKRDWAAERANILAAIEAMSTEEEVIAARDMVKAFEADGQNVTDLKAAYAKKPKPKKAPASSPAAAPAAPAATTPPADAPAAATPKAEG